MHLIFYMWSAKAIAAIAEAAAHPVARQATFTFHLKRPLHARTGLAGSVLAPERLEELPAGAVAAVGPARGRVPQLAGQPVRGGCADQHAHAGEHEIRLPATPRARVQPSHHELAALHRACASTPVGVTTQGCLSSGRACPACWTHAPLPPQQCECSLLPMPAASGGSGTNARTLQQSSPSTQWPGAALRPRSPTPGPSAPPRRTQRHAKAAAQPGGAVGRHRCMRSTRAAALTHRSKELALPLTSHAARWRHGCMASRTWTGLRVTMRAG